MSQTDEEKRAAFAKKTAEEARAKELQRRADFQKARDEAVKAFNAKQAT